MTLQSSGLAAGDGDVEKLGPWFHNLHLPDGTQTAPDHPLGDFPSYKWEALRPVLPHDLAGMSVLDIGCNAGFYSVELARLGARVLGVDHDPHYLRQAAWARRRFGLDEEQLELRELTAYDVLRIGRRFDLVLFMGVLYHLRYPMLALDTVTEVVGGTLVFQTLCAGEEVHGLDTPEDLAFKDRGRLHEPGWPIVSFVEHKLAGDPTNWWVPSRPAVEAMLRSCGLRVAARPVDEVWICVPERPNPNRGELARATGRSAPHRSAVD